MCRSLCVHAHMYILYICALARPPRLHVMCCAAPGHPPCLLCKGLEVGTKQSLHLLDVVTKVLKLPPEDVQGVEAHFVIVGLHRGTRSELTEPLTKSKVCNKTVAYSVSH